MVSKMIYNVSSGTLSSTIPYLSISSVDQSVNLYISLVLTINIVDQSISVVLVFVSFSSLSFTRWHVPLHLPVLRPASQAGPMHDLRGGLENLI